MEWQGIESAPEKVIVQTKIEDRDGMRNVQELLRQGRMWWYPDMSMYVYYQPTHWRHVSTHQ